VSEIGETVRMKLRSALCRRFGTKTRQRGGLAPGQAFGSRN
jgi:hypothetical protein